MNTNEQMSIAGALQVVQSIPALVFSTYYITTLIHILKSGSQTLGEPAEVILMLFLFFLIFLIGAVLLWFGYSLLREKAWPCRIGGFICCAPGFIAFPHGISAYTFWILLQVNKEKRP